MACNFVKVSWLACDKIEREREKERLYLPELD